MTPSRFIDEIDRLFNELVRDPWRSPREAARRPPAAGETELEVAVPADERSAHAVSVSLEGGRLLVSLRRAQEESGVVGETRFASEAGEQVQRSFAVPPGATLRAVETRFEQGEIRIRVRLGSSR